MKTKLFLISMLLLTAVGGVNAQPSLSGSGTESDPYQISSTTDLATLANYVNAGNTCHELYFVMTQDIDYNPASNIENNHTPIGDGTHHFQGNFDGRGHIIKGIRITLTTTDNVGLFGSIDYDAKVKNVHVKSTKIQGKNRVGGIVGSDYSSDVINCQVTNSEITGTDNTSDAGYTGGIVGYTEGNVSDITECVFNGTVTAAKNLAGIVGYNNQSYSRIASCLVINSTINGSSNNIIASNLESESGHYFTNSLLGLSGGQTQKNNCYVIALPTDISLTITPTPTTTGIVSLENDKSANAVDDTWFDLSGRPINGRPVKSGIYLHNGMKTVIK